MKKTLIAILALSLVVFFAPVSVRAITTDGPTGDVTTVTDLPTGDTTTGQTSSDDDSTPSGDTTTVSGPSEDDLPPPGDTTTVSGPSTPTTPTSTPPTTDVPPTHAPTDPNVGPTGGGGFSGGFGSGFTLPTGSVLGASTDDATSTASNGNCSISFVNFMKRGQRGADVRELQAFLNKELGLHIPLTGYFGSQTEAAVKAFQLKYAADILAPWVNVGKLPSTSAATGYVYKTTLRKINLIRCASLNIPQIAPADLN